MSPVGQALAAIRQAFLRSQFGAWQDIDHLVVVRVFQISLSVRIFSKESREEHIEGLVKAFKRPCKDILKSV